MVNEPKIQHPASNSLISCFPDIHFLITGLPDILLCLSAFVATLIMQNEPNFGNDKMNVTSVMTNRYEKKGHLVNGKNEPKTNPKRTQTCPP